MNSAILEQKEIFHEVNSITGSTASVIFGEERFAELPVSELVQDFGLNISVCNRSVEHATILDAFDLLDECIFELHPRRVFLNFGETDLARPGFDRARFLADYARLIERIREGCSGRIYLVSVLSDGDEADRLNAGLADLASRKDCSYVDAADIFRHEKPHLHLFRELMHYMREGRISFAEAMHAM